MSFFFDPALVASYTSNSQKVRVMSEDWIAHNLSCPFCRMRLTPYSANKIGYDFFCEQCKENFQLKSFRRRFCKSIRGGEYQRTVEKFQNGTLPHLLLLLYEPKDWGVLGV